MLRKALVALVAGLVSSVLVLSSAAAGTKNPTGVISCTLSGGTLSLSPWLTNTASTATVAMAISGAGPCDNSGVIGGKAPITDMSITYSATLDTGATCADALPQTVPSSTSFQITWQYRKSSNKLKTVAVTTGELTALAVGFLGDWGVFLAPDPGGAFADSLIRLEVFFDGVAASSACATVNGWTSSTLTGGTLEAG